MLGLDRFARRPMRYRSRARALVQLPASSIAGTALRVEMPVETGALESLPEVVFTRIRQMTRQSRVHLRLFLA